MTAQELKNSILQLAVQGKLVPQDKNDEPASELLKRIQAEKARLIKEGKIKKEKALPPIAEEELPFDIPESWEWLKLGEIVQIISGTSYKSHDVVKDGLRILRGGNLQNTKVKYAEDDVFLPITFLEKEKTIKENDILIVASTGSKTVIGKPGFVFQTDPKTQIGAFLRIVRPISNVIAPYIRVIFSSEYYRNHIRNQVQGMNINNVKEEHLSEFLIPIPPLAEQQRIVDKIEELLPLIEEYGKAEARLKELNADFPDMLRKSILQQAVQGKLTERNPEDEPASELLKRIQAEKAQLIKDGKLKKEKSLPPITEDEIPFDIPDTWAWIKLGDLTQIQSSKRVFEKDYVTGGVPFFRSKEIGDLQRGQNIHTPLFISNEHYLQLKEKYGVPNKGDILITSVGTIGNTWICDGREFYYKDGNITQICKNNGFYPQYICGQYWHNRNLAEIAILDEGIGVYESLNKNAIHKDYITNNDDALRWAIKPGVSCAFNPVTGPKKKGDWANSGYGLHMISEICKSTKGGWCTFASNDNCLRIYSNTTTAESITFRGTALGIRIGTGDIKNAQAMIDAARLKGEETAKNIKHAFKSASRPSRGLM